MRVFWSWMVPAAFVVVSCGGKVVLDASAGAGGFGTGTGTGTGLGGLGSVVGAGAAGAIGAAGGVGTGGDCVPTCAQALAQGGVPCDNGNAPGNYASLQKCAGCSDTGNCEGVCGSTLCGSIASSAECTTCLSTSCEMEFVACEHS
jgi:hypothetical protein